MKWKKRIVALQKNCGVTLIVNVNPSEDAKQTTEEFFKALITKISMALEMDCE